MYLQYSMPGYQTDAQFWCLALKERAGSTRVSSSGGRESPIGPIDSMTCERCDDLQGIVGPKFLVQRKNDLWHLRKLRWEYQLWRKVCEAAKNATWQNAVSAVSHDAADTFRCATCAEHRSPAIPPRWSTASAHSWSHHQSPRISWRAVPGIQDHNDAINGH